jgi:hypothetical protein
MLPNFQPLIVETYISAFQRAIAAVGRDDIASLSWYTCAPGAGGVDCAARQT